ncbi:unnamed protein product [Rhizoctonia solani]|uniref:Uncharacterized protein n=1 Tax=Rhizoctonia solani TaxID=456999 RepID=A0A8H3AWU4_9AGAM|nr:unnamed protein product [Rhizoctonia solani]
MSSLSNYNTSTSPNERVSKPRTTRATARTSIECSHAQASRATMPNSDQSIDKVEYNNSSGEILNPPPSLGRKSELDDHVAKAFQDTETLTDTFVEKVTYILKLALVHDRNKADARKERRAFREIKIKYLEQIKKYENTLSPEDEARYRERKLEEARACRKNAEVADSSLHREKVELEFKLSLAQKENSKLKKELKKANNTHENAEVLND